MDTRPLVDSFGRVHDNLRISVTDRCNIRCFYCMPEQDVHFMERGEILSFEEIERFVRVAVRLGLLVLALGLVVSTSGLGLFRLQGLPQLQTGTTARTIACPARRATNSRHRRYISSTCG